MKKILFWIINCCIFESFVFASNNSLSKASFNTTSSVNQAQSLNLSKSLLSQNNVLKFKPMSSYGKILSENKVPVDMTIQETREALFEIIQGSREKISQELSFKAGKPKRLFGKNVGINIDHIVNVNPEFGGDRKITLQGGHMYKVLAAFKSQGFINNPSSTKDDTTKCWLFDGRDIITGDRFYKTTFPQGWTVEDIYQAIMSSTKIEPEEYDNKGHLIIKASVQYKKHPEFIIRCVLYPRQGSDTWELMTVFPEASQFANIS